MLGPYIMLLALSALPPVQRRAGVYVASLLAGRIESRVAVGGLKPGMGNRIVLDNVQVYDRQDSLMLDISRIAVKIDLYALLSGRVHIYNAQIIGARTHLYQREEGGELNIGFLADAFSSKDDDNGTGIDLQAETFIVRRSSVRFDRYHVPETAGRFQPGHVDVRDLSLTARINRLTRDSINVTLKKLGFRERSGLHLAGLSFEAAAGRGSVTVKDLLLETENSALLVPVARVSYPAATAAGSLKNKGNGTDDEGGNNEKESTNTTSDGNTPKGNDKNASADNGGHEGKDAAATARHPGAADIRARAEILGDVRPADFAALMPKLANFTCVMHVEADIALEGGDAVAEGLTIHDADNMLALTGECRVDDIFGTPAATLHVRALDTREGAQDFVLDNIFGSADRHIAALDALGGTHTHGTLRYDGRNVEADIHTLTDIGEVSARGRVRDMNEVDMHVGAYDVDLGALTGHTGGLGTLSFEGRADGMIKAADGRPHVTARGNVEKLVYRGYPHRNIPFALSAGGGGVEAQASVSEPNGSAGVELRTGREGGTRNITLRAEVGGLSPYNMNLTRRYVGERFGGSLEAELSVSDTGGIGGEVRLTDFVVEGDSLPAVRPGDVTVTYTTDEEGQHLGVSSPFLNADAQGCFEWRRLYASLLDNTHGNLPGLIPAPRKTADTLRNEFAFSCRLRDTLLIRRLAGLDLGLPREAVVQGEMSDGTGRVVLTASAPELVWGGSVLRHTQLRAESNADIMQASLRTERVMRGNPVELGVEAFANRGAIRANLAWDNRKRPAQKGSVGISGRILHDASGRQGVEAVFGMSDIIINDTAWSVSPGRVSYDGSGVDISGLKVSSGDRHLTLDGRMSPRSEDTLAVGLRNISLSYIFNMIDFHAVEFDGKATGRVTARSLTGSPQAAGRLTVKGFTFNEAYLGDMDLRVGYGTDDDGITLEADIRDTDADHRTVLKGRIKPGRGTRGGLDLDIHTRRISLAFLNKYTSGIFTALQGRASGHTRIYGPFKNIDLEGGLMAEQVSLHVNALGTDYRMDRDSIILRHGDIALRGADIYDHLGGPGAAGHRGHIEGHLMHDHLSRLRYDFGIEADNMLLYNTTALEGGNFYGTAYATGSVRIQGAPGSVNVNVEGTPENGTTMVYNVTSPDAITEAGFITYTSRADSADTAAAPGSVEPPTPATDIRIDMNLNVTPRAAMKLVMDQRSGDYISLHGSGHLLAKYYNKGRFQLFGTYRTDHGVYKLSMQDVIHKDFQFRPDGVIVFGGDPYQAALNLQATYTVPNVSLDDLSYSGLGLSNTRVDCVMNITGAPRQPVVSFDFDLPNANEDEKLMVRSMISTEEERNMQVIYLLGIGRFYSYGAQYASRGNRQGEVAVNSLISSTLSSQFNQIISSAVGNNNWTFGTNLRTGEEGWNQLDVEGMLSGRLLDNRLLLNGNFGYRESYYNDNNFIGDFDIQYVLNKARTLSLKAYNQTNDRYFIQSSLTTQGIGLSFRHDFNSWRTLLGKRRKKPSTSQPADSTEQGKKNKTQTSGGTKRKWSRQSAAGRRQQTKME